MRRASSSTNGSRRSAGRHRAAAPLLALLAALLALAQLLPGVAAGDLCVGPASGTPQYASGAPCTGTPTYTNISAAIAAAAKNDVIWVAKGAYSEAITFTSKVDITIKGRQAGVSAGPSSPAGGRATNYAGGDTASVDETIINPSATTIFTIYNSNGIVLDGLLITNSNFATAITGVSYQSSASYNNIIQNCECVAQNEHVLVFVSIDTFQNG